MLRFKASWMSVPLLDAVLNYLETGYGKSAQIRIWEQQAIARMGWTEAQWLKLSLEERARLVVAPRVNNWFTALELQKQREDAKAGGR